MSSSGPVKDQITDDHQRDRPATPQTRSPRSPISSVPRIQLRGDYAIRQLDPAEHSRYKFMTPTSSSVICQSTAGTGVAFTGKPTPFAFTSAALTSSSSSSEIYQSAAAIDDPQNCQSTAGIDYYQMDLSARTIISDDNAIHPLVPANYHQSRSPLSLPHDNAMFHHQQLKPDGRLPPSEDQLLQVSVPPWQSWGLEGRSTTTSLRHNRIEQVQAKDHVITIFSTPQYSNNGEATFVSDFKHMKPQVYKAIRMGNHTDHEFKLEVEEQEGISARGNTILHVASSLGHSGLVDQILSRHPNSNLIFNKNTTGNLALHLAAAGGHQTVVQILVRHAEACGSLDLLVQENEDKNTALHLAIKNNHRKLAIFLVEKNPDATIKVNREEVSPLYMAAEAGDVELVNTMLKSRPADDMGFFQGKSLVHAAIQGMNKVEQAMEGAALSPKPESENKERSNVETKRPEDVLDAVMRHQSSNMPADVLHMVKRYQTTSIATSVDGRPSYCISFDDGVKSETSFCFVLLDEEGKTPLSFASSIGYLKGVCYFLDKSFDATYTRDQDGSYPIHEASKRGYVKIIKKFIERCPDSWELLDREGKNILHVAAESGKWNVVKYILGTSELAMLINERDKKGNTPLHLATKNGHARVVTIMTWDKRVDLKLENDEGRTALDVSDNDSETAYSFVRRLTWLALRYAGAPRAKKLSTSRVSKQSPSKMNMEKTQRPKRQHDEPLNMDSYKDRVNTLLVVATLVATVTFAAGFTMPGGFNSSDDPHKGMAVLLEKRMFCVFLISNTIAMYSSIIVDILLFWALMNDLRLGLSSLEVAVPLLGISLLMVSLAFMAAIYIVVRNLTWLSVVVLIIGSLSLLFLSLLILPLSFPISLHHRISRYIVRYPFYLLILVIERISTKE